MNYLKNIISALVLGAGIAVFMPWPQALYSQANAGKTKPAETKQESSTAPTDNKVGEDVSQIPDIIVVGERDDEIGLTPRDRAGCADAAALLKQDPGVNIVRNGSQTGIPQVRGIYGDRVNVLVDGMSITPACPNHMDPPLHYISPHLVEDVFVVKGIGSVTTSADGLGKMVSVNRIRPIYAAEEATDFVHASEIGTYFDGKNFGHGGYAQSVIGLNHYSFGYAGSVDTADDMRFPGGTVKASEYFHTDHTVFGSVKGEYGELLLRLGTTNSDNVGTPALPMDLIEDNGYRLGLDYNKSWDDLAFTASFYAHSVDHLMDRFTLRPSAGIPPMQSAAESRDFGGKIMFEFPVADEHTLRVGQDFHLAYFNATQENVANRMLQDMFNDSEKNRTGIFAEWEAGWIENLTTTLGVRGDLVQTDTGRIGRTMSVTAATDATSFNRSDKEKTFANFDVTLEALWEPLEWLDIGAGFSRNSRSPGFVELYNYTPAQSSAGLADGRDYIGNLGLTSEVSHHLETTVGFKGTKWRVEASPYYTFVTDYIQGTRSGRFFGGQEVLQFSNVDANSMAWIPAPTGNSQRVGISPDNSDTSAGAM